MSHATAVAKSEDDLIWVKRTMENGVTYYGIGKTITVKWRGLGDGEDRQYWCLTHNVNACEHTRRVDRFRMENFT